MLSSGVLEINGADDDVTVRPIYMISTISSFTHHSTPCILTIPHINDKNSGIINNRESLYIPYILAY